MGLDGTDINPGGGLAAMTAATEAQTVEAVTRVRDYNGVRDVKAELKRFGKPLSRFGELAADILGQAFYGTKYLDCRAIRLGKWDDEEWAEVPLPWHRELANYDTDHLTRLVVMCADSGVRFGINAGLMVWEYDHNASESEALGYDVTNDHDALAETVGVRFVSCEWVDRPNDDFDPKEPEDEDNPRTVKKLMSIGPGPCMVLRLRLIVPNSKRAKSLGHSGVGMLDAAKADIERLSWPVGWSRAKYPDLYPDETPPAETGS